MTATTVSRTSARPKSARQARAATDGANALRLDRLEQPEFDRPEFDRPEFDRLTFDRPARRPTIRPDAATDVPAGALADAPAAALPAPSFLPRLRLVVLALALVGVGVVGVLVINTRINENAFRLNDLRNRQDSLDQKEQQLSGELAEFDSPGNLAAEARRLGLVPAGTPAYVRLPDGRVIGVPQPATSTPAPGAGQPGR